MLFATTIFVSAFLLFQVQPLVARIILPWFGGSAAVWTSCMLFFQLLLVGGYLYSHWLVHRKPRTQTYVHLALLALALITLPIAPDPAWKPIDGADPTLRIIGLLGVCVGLPYFLLSTTSPLVQSWYSRAKHGAMPYRLFALSNFGSMLALLSYPLVVEPTLTLRAQTLTWSAGFVLFALCVGALAWVSRDTPLEPAQVKNEPAARPGVNDYVLWIALPAVASILLLAFTTHLSTNVAPIPFLWVLPLALYLLSFILCFEGRGWYRRSLYLPLLAVGLVGVTYTLTRGNIHQPLLILLPLYAMTLFAICMVCHGELARMQPAPRYLTAYFVMISVGGAIGGLFVSLFAPAYFSELHELPVGLVAVVLVTIGALARDRNAGNARIPGPALLGLAIAAGALAFWLQKIYAERAEDDIVQVRNFYAALHVQEYGEGDQRQRLLLHGTITHGRQFIAAGREDLATTYYATASGVGLAIRGRADSPMPDSPMRLGVVGLGVGTLATYGRAGDTIRMYEINPQIVDIANNQFTYLKRSKAKIELAVGDARLVLDRESPQAFDVLAIDAFSSDAIPVHLLTVEAFATYFKHMKPDGILAVHISNRYLDLEPVILEAANAHGKVTRYVSTDSDGDRVDTGVYGSTWVLLGANDATFAHPIFKELGPVKTDRKIRRWTDDYSDLFAILK